MRKALCELNDTVLLYTLSLLNNVVEQVILDIKVTQESIVISIFKLKIH